MENCDLVLRSAAYSQKIKVWLRAREREGGKGNNEQSEEKEQS